MRALNLFMCADSSTKTKQNKKTVTAMPRAKATDPTSASANTIHCRLVCQGRTFYVLGNQPIYPKTDRKENLPKQMSKPSIKYS